MDNHQHDAQPPSGRRKFLRQLGMTAAATAALSGLADVAGLRPAAAATRAKARGAGNRASLVPDETVRTVVMSCNVCSGCCGSPCTPSGVYCHYCVAYTEFADGTYIDSFAGFYCIGGGSGFTLAET